MPTFFYFIFFKISRLSTRCFEQCLPKFFFHAMDFGSSEHSEEKYMKYTFCLGLVGARYPSELELPVNKQLVQVSLILSTFSESFLELL